MDKIFVYACPTNYASHIIGCAIDNNKTLIAKHVSSNLDFVMQDMGVTSELKHDIYKNKYPHGYEIVWLGLIENAEQFIQSAGRAGVEVRDIVDALALEQE